MIAIGTALTLLGLGLVQAATARALVELDGGRPIGPLRAYRLARDSIRPLLGALFVAAIVVSLLASSIYLFPLAIWLAGRWALIAPSIELEELPGSAGTATQQQPRARQVVQGRIADRRRRGPRDRAGPLVGVALILTTERRSGSSISSRASSTR